LIKMTTPTPNTSIQKAKIDLQLPADLKAEFAADALDIKNRLGQPSGDYIGVGRNKTFVMPGTEEESPQLRAIILDWVSVNQFYEGKYDPKNIRPPVCASIGVLVPDMKPLASAPKKQFDGLCADCPQNQWGSDGSGKACKNQRLLALLPVNDQADGPLMLVKVSPTGIKYFDKYAAMVANTNPDVPHVVSMITAIYFDEAADYPSLRFRAESLNPDVVVAAGRRKEARQRLLVEPSFGPAAAPVGK
jgi:hypothetical protein